MPTNDDLMISTISDALAILEKNVIINQSNYYEEILDGITNMDFKGGKLVQSQANVKEAARIKQNLSQFLKQSENTEYVKEFADTFISLEDINKDYYKSIVDTFKPDKALNVFKTLATNSLVDNLVGAGINGKITNQVFNIFNQNISAGTTRRELISQLNTFIKGNDEVLGGMQRYAKQIATDSINQFNASYNTSISDGLGFKWYRYVGRIKDTSRPFCKGLIQQRYIHKSEFADASLGILRYKTVSTAGMVGDTNKDNLLVYRGGYNCNHQFRGVTDRSVPDSVKVRIK